MANPRYLSLAALLLLILPALAMGWQVSVLAPCSRAAAWALVKDRVDAALIAPAAAVYPGLADVRIERLGPCGWRVLGHVEAPNFNGLALRADFAAVTGRGPGGRPIARVERIETRQPETEALGLAVPLHVAGG